MWNLFTTKTLLERAGLRTGAPGMAAFLSGAWVSGTLGVWNPLSQNDLDPRFIELGTRLESLFSDLREFAVTVHAFSHNRNRECLVAVV